MAIEQHGSNQDQPDFLLDLELSADGRHWDLVVVGELDLATADRLVDAGLKALALGEAKGLALDLSEVTFLDAAGVGALVRLRNAALEVDRYFELGDCSLPVLRVLRLTGLDSVFDSPVELFGVPLRRPRLVVLPGGGTTPRTPHTAYDPDAPDGHRAG
jgi:anti-anti-sigma factor